MQDNNLTTGSFYYGSINLTLFLKFLYHLARYGRNLNMELQLMFE